MWKATMEQVNSRCTSTNQTLQIDCISSYAVILSANQWWYSELLYPGTEISQIVNLNWAVDCCSLTFFLYQTSNAPIWKELHRRDLMEQSFFSWQTSRRSLRLFSSFNNMNLKKIIPFHAGTPRWKQLLTKKTFPQTDPKSSWKEQKSINW